MFVDDAGLEGRHAVERGLAAIAATLAPLQLADSSVAAMPAAQQAAAVQRQGLWQQRVALQLVSKVSLLLLVFCRRCKSAGCATSLAGAYLQA